MLIYSGRVPEGLALLDEAMVGISTGDVSPIVRRRGLLLADRGLPGGLRLRPRGRVDQRADRVDRRPARTGPLHRSVRGAPRADHARPRRLPPQRSRSSASRPSGTTPPDTPAPAGLAMSECGEVLRIVGDLPCRRGGVRAGRRLRLRGRSRAWPCCGWRGGVPRPPSAPSAGCSPSRGDPVHRSQLLPGAVAGAARAGEAIDEAVAATDELDGIADGLRHARPCGPWPTTRGGARCWPAATPARRCRRSAGRLRVWRDLDAPYEAARARVLVGRALRELGDDGHRDRRADRGAADVQRARGRARPSARRPRCSGPTHPAGLTEREVEVLRLVARRTHQPGDRRDAGDQREDGRAPPLQHLHQARRGLTHRAAASRSRTGLV